MASRPVADRDEPLCAWTHRHGDYHCCGTPSAACRRSRSLVEWDTCLKFHCRLRTSPNRRSHQNRRLGSCLEARRTCFGDRNCERGGQGMIQYLQIHTAIRSHFHLLVVVFDLPSSASIWLSHPQTRCSEDSSHAGKNDTPKLPDLDQSVPV